MRRLLDRWRVFTWEFLAPARPCGCRYRLGRWRTIVCGEHFLEAIGGRR